MRQLKLQVQVSIDGFIAGPQHEMDWLTLNWSDDIKDYVNTLTASMDTILLGRVLAQGFIPHWAQVANNPNDPEHMAGLIFNETPKVVFSKTIQEATWHNTMVANGELVEEVMRLKQQDGKDLMVYGGAQLVSALLKHQLVDELYLFVNPVVLGQGLGIFNQVETPQSYHLHGSQAFDCGIMVLNYKLLT